ncbi:uncharacterized protein RCC_06643 [Ramularia collo-cygni]|uniref:Uncharacterized protein n=1 Tax=Ramularia collo-cygni TaxID=112498 RepID=A0A2D3V227_9PEZI|nr:uncharacterized protein RCC_06643 [Ramularia collo-cygni]CZT20785.1 uncharacterized protein RCC_06643 [Ramularia collo-cygni]
MPSASEHHDIRIVSVDVIPPMGYPFLSIKEPATKVQFARERTLACGKPLYEVWDFRKRRLLGYNIPTSVFQETRKHHDWPVDLKDWTALPCETRHEFFKTQQLVTDLFPGLPIASSKSITEKLIQQSYRGYVSNEDIEEEVVKHAKYCWTAFLPRMEHKRREGKMSVWEEETVDVSVRSRIRSVLGEWMMQDNSTKKENFFGRHGLLEVVRKRDSLGAEVEYEGAKTYGGKLVWMNDGSMSIVGAETVAAGQKPTRRFL